MRPFVPQVDDAKSARAKIVAPRRYVEPKAYVETQVHVGPTDDYGANILYVNLNDCGTKEL